jgi:BMFP domain-containing protein YqiC
MSCGDYCDVELKDCGKYAFDGDPAEFFAVAAEMIIECLKDVLKEKAKLDAEEKRFREDLQALMEKFDVRSREDEVIKLTYIAPSTRESIDAAKLKAQMPDVAAKFTKSSAVKAFVKVELKK